MGLSALRDSSAFWHEQYDVGSGVFVGPENKEVRLNWHSSAVVPSYQPYVDKVINALSITAQDRVAVIGGGFGEFRFVALRDHTDFLPGNWVSCEDSAWVQASKAETEDNDIRISILASGENPMTAPGLAALTQLTNGRTRGSPDTTILKENLLTSSSRVNVKAALGGSISVVLTEWTVMNYLTDAEAVAFSAAAHASPLSAAVKHLVRASLDTNGRGLTEWKALLPNDTFLDWGTLQVV